MTNIDLGHGNYVQFHTYLGKKKVLITEYSIQEQNQGEWSKSFEKMMEEVKEKTGSDDIMIADDANIW